MLSREKICAVTLGLLLAIPGLADVVTNAVAGSTPATALDLTSISNLTEISGSLDNTNPDLAAVFEIDITSPLFFSAISIYAGAFGVPDTELFLFDAIGNGIYENDDISGANTQSCLPAFNAVGNLCPATSSLGPLTPGDYYLAITPSQNSPVDISDNEIFSPVSSTDVVGPNSGVGSFFAWDDGYFTSPDTDLVKYDIVISDSPEPAAWPVIAALGLAFILFRRRLCTR